MKVLVKPTLARCLPGFMPVVVAGLLMSSVSPAQSAVVTAKKGDSFVDTIGVNLHLGYEGGVYSYSNHDVLITRLQEMGIRHERDGFENPGIKQYIKDWHNELGRLGIKGTFLSGGGLTPSQVLQSADLMRDSVEAIEGQNEILNIYSGWSQAQVDAARQYQIDLFNTFKGSSYWNSTPVLGPTCVGYNAYQALGNLSAYMDIGNAHAYPLGKGPAVSDSGYFNELNGANLVAPGKQFMVTETGYNTGTWDAGHPRVSAAAAAKYAPRLYLENFNRGILRSFWYELVNEGSGGSQEESFGLVNDNYTYKPQGTAIRNLTTLLKDATYNTTTRKWDSPAFTPGALNYTLTGNTANVHSTLLQKSNGKYYLCLWQEVSSYDNSSHTDINNPSVGVTLNLTTPITKAFSYYPTSSTTANTLTISNNTINLSVPDEVMIVSLTPAASTAGPNLASNPGFETEQFGTQTPSGWSEWSSVGGVGVGYTENNGANHSGNFHGTHYSTGTYNMYTYQYKGGLTNGLYTLKAWVVRSGGQNTCQLEAKDYGGSTVAVQLPVTNTWTQVSIPNINVTNGQCTFGIWSDANAGNWCGFDDFEFFRQ